MNSATYRFQAPDEVYKSTTFIDTTFKKMYNMKKCSMYCLTFLFMVLFTGSVLVSFVYVSDDEIGYYSNTGSDKIMYPGLNFHFMWNPDKPKFARTTGSLYVPTVLYNYTDFISSNITIDYKVTNIPRFVQKIAQDDHSCMHEIIKTVKNSTTTNNTSIYADFSAYDQIYTVFSLLNTTIDTCGITITNATFPKHHVSYESTVVKNNNNLIADIVGNTPGVADIVGNVDGNTPGVGNVDGNTSGVGNVDGNTSGVGNVDGVNSLPLPEESTTNGSAIFTENTPYANYEDDIIN